MSDWPILWNARWIWSAPAIAGTGWVAGFGIPPEQTWNRFCHLRKQFTISQLPASAPARVTADSRFVLFVNGRELARGPARSIPERLAYDSIDLAPYLVRGKNVIAALVRYYGAPCPWWRPAAPSLQLGLGSFAFEAPSLGIRSDSTWKGKPAPYQQQVPRNPILPSAPMEILDGAGVPAGWSEPGYDDSEWPAAAELHAGTFALNRTTIPVEPYTAPEYCDIAPLTAIPQSLKLVSSRAVEASLDSNPLAAYSFSAATGDQTNRFHVYDAGAMTIATPWVEVSGERSAIVDVYAGEELRADGAVEIRPATYAFRYKLGGSGLERAESFEPIGFRYLAVVTRGKAEIKSVGAIERHYPRSGDAVFECDNERLNKIWQVGARTLDLCSTDAFLDCPGREQRAWLGDSYVHSLVSFVSNTDWRLVPRNLRIGAQSQRGDGLLSMVAAGDFSFASTTIPDFSLHWIRALTRYYEYSGDLATVTELLPNADRVTAAFERYRGDDGLIRRMPGWIFIDWAMTERGEVVGALDALYAAALDDYSKLCDASGAVSKASTARRNADRTRKGFELLWDNSACVYVDAADGDIARRRVSQQTNAIAIVSGCAPANRWARILDHVSDTTRLVITPTISDNPSAYIQQRFDPSEFVKFDPETNVVAAQAFFSHFVHQAVVKAGRRNLIPSLCERWWAQLERGNTSFEEYWNAAPGTGSRCHAWSATPTYDLTTHVLGVSPAEPGYKRASIKPLFGSLRWMRGKVPTPHGIIEIDLTRDGGTIVIPDGVTAAIEFSDVALRGGEFAPGRHSIRSI